MIAFKGYNLLDNLRGTVKIYQPLVNPHLKPVPSFGPFTTGCLTGGNLQILGWHTHRSLNFQFLFLCSTDQIRTYYVITQNKIKSNTFSLLDLANL